MVGNGLGGGGGSVVFGVIRFKYRVWFRVIEIYLSFSGGFELFVGFFSVFFCCVSV